MQLDVARERRGVAARVAQPRLVEAGASERTDELLAAAARRRERFVVETSCEREAAEQADERPLLVREVDRLECHRQLEARSGDDAQDLERGEDAERSVVAAPVRDAV